MFAIGCGEPSRSASRDAREDATTPNAPSPKPTHTAVPVVDFTALLQSTEEDVSAMPAPERCTLSQFTDTEPSRPLRVTIAMRGIPKAQVEEVEEHVWKILSQRTPQPWELQKATKGEPAARDAIHVEVKRQNTKLRRATKTAPAHYEGHYSISISTKIPPGMRSSWDAWQFDVRDGVIANHEAGIQGLFWNGLQQALPTLVLYPPENTVQWMLSLQLRPQVLENGLASVSVPAHTVVETGCILSRETPRTHSLRTLQSPWAVPQTLEIAEVLDMRCTPESIFAAALETPVRAALYYQPIHAQHAWKSQITFADSITSNGLRMHLDDDLVCLYTGTQPTARSGEIQCVDRRTGIMRWRTKRFSGPIRGISFHDKSVEVATDKAVYSVRRDGTVQTVRPMHTLPRMREPLYCQLQDRLIFSTGPGQFRAWNAATQSFDWQTSVFESRFLHCGLQNTLILSDTGGYLLAFDVEHNTPLWKYRPVSMPHDALSQGESVFLLMHRAVVVLDRATGAIRAQFPLPWLATRFIRDGQRLYFDTPGAVYTWR